MRDNQIPPGHDLIAIKNNVDVKGSRTTAAVSYPMICAFNLKADIQ
jgi:hypothetical protein